MSGKHNTLLRYTLETALPEVQMQPNIKKPWRHQPDILHSTFYIFNYMHKIHYNGDAISVKT